MSLFRYFALWSRSNGIFLLNNICLSFLADVLLVSSMVLAYVRRLCHFQYKNVLDLVDVQLLRKLYIHGCVNEIFHLSFWLQHICHCNVTTRCRSLTFYLLQTFRLTSNCVINVWEKITYNRRDTCALKQTFQPYNYVLLMFLCCGNFIHKLD